MGEHESPLRVRSSGKVIHLEFRDQMIAVVDLSKIETHVGELIGEVDKPNVVINFDHVEFLPTTGLGTLVIIHKWVRERDGRLRLANLAPPIREMFRISRLDEILDIFDNVEAASLD